MVNSQNNKKQLSKERADLQKKITFLEQKEKEYLHKISTLQKKLSEKKNQAEPVNDNELKFRNVVESSPMGIHMYSLEKGDRLVFIGANKAADEILGVDNSLFIGKTIEEAFPPLANTEVPVKYKNACSKGESWKTVQINYEDEKIKGAFQVHAFQTSPGKMAALFLDITKRVKSEAALKASEERFRGLVETTSDWIWEVDIDGKYVYSSPKVKDVLGYEPYEIIGKTPFDLMPKEEGERIALEYEKIKSRKKSLFRLKNFNYHKNGKFVWLETSGVPVFDNEGNLKGYRGIDRDITERIQTEKLIQNQHDLAIRMSEVNNLDETLNLGLKTAMQISTMESGGFYLMDEKRGLKLSCSIGLSEKFLKHGEYYPAESMHTDLVMKGTPVYITSPKLDSLLVKEQKKDGLRSLAIIPIIHVNKVIGCLNLGTKKYLKIPSTIRESLETLTVRIGGFITRIQTEQILQENEIKYRTLFESASDAIFLIQKDRFIDCNKKTLEIYGCKRNQIIGKTPYDFSPSNQPDGRNSKEKALEKIKAAFKGKNQLFEWQHIKYDGTPFLTEVNLNQIKLGDKDLILAIVRDLTERKKAAEALLESEAQYHELVKLLPQTVFETDLEGNLTFVNLAAFKTFGYSQEDFDAGLNNLDMIAPEDREKAKKNINLFLSNEDPGFNEYKAQRKDGSKFPVLIYTNRIIQKNKPIGLRGIIVDITDKKQLEEQLRQSQKMESIGRLAGGIAHDFNNLLTVITGYSELALTTLKSNDPIYTDLTEIKNASSRASELTKQLLAFSRKQVMKPKNLDLNFIVREMEKMLKRMIGEDIQLTTVLSSQECVINADEGQISQIIANLAVNARDAMPRGGDLTIETKQVYLDEDYQKNHSVVSPGNYVLLTISDTGFGMDKETQSKIFEPFFTTKERGQGTGLGLSTVYGIVNQSGGHIWVYSEKGEGTSFKIYFPLIKDKVKNDTKIQTTREYFRGSETILIVEDDDTVKGYASKALQQYGYKILEAKNGGEALMLCEKYKKTIHLMITDVVMPNMNGQELSKRLALIKPDMKTLFMSGYTDNTIVHHGVLERGIKFLPKPFSPIELLKSVRDILDEPAIK